MIQLAQFHWAALAPWRAARVATGVAAPLALGWASGHVEYGAFAALGALPAGFASFQGVSRSRITAVAVASVGMALATFVGATVATTPWLVLAAVVVYGYFTGLMVCLGQRLSVAALQWAVGFLIALGLPLPLRDAAVRAGLVLAAGLFQAVLVAGAWMLRRGESERAALARSYRGLADYAARLAAGRVEPPPPIDFPAMTMLADPNPLLTTATRLMLLDLLEEAERIRASLAAVADAHSVDARDGDEIRRLCGDASSTLELIAGVLEAERAERARRIHDAGRRLAVLTVATDVAHRWAGEALLGQLRAVIDILRRLDDMPSNASARDTTGSARPAIALPAVGDGIVASLVTLRANLTPGTEAGRHAVRLAAAAGLAELLVHVTALPSSRWVVLTILLVLKPDYASTVSRSVHRSLGTALGAILGVAAAQLGLLGEGGLVVAAGASVAVAYAVFEVNYLLFSVFLTSFIVVLLEILGIPALATAGPRLIDTAIGAALAIVAFVAWPTWGRLTAQESFARLFDAHRELAVALLRQLSSVGSLDLSRLRALQRAARRARSDAEAAATRLCDEPSHPPLTPDVARLVIAAARRLAHAELALHALVAARPRQVGADVCQPLDALATALATALSELSRSVRRLESVAPAPALRRLQSEMSNAPHVDPALVRITAALVDAVETLEAIVRDHLPSREDEQSE